MHREHCKAWTFAMAALRSESQQSWNSQHSCNGGNNKVASSSIHMLSSTKIRSGPGKPKNQRKVSSWTFHRGIPEQEFNVNRACFPKEKHQNLQKYGRNSWTFRFGPFLGLVCRGRLLKKDCMRNFLLCKWLLPGYNYNLHHQYSSDGFPSMCRTFTWKTSITITWIVV